MGLSVPIGPRLDTLEAFRVGRALFTLAGSREIVIDAGALTIPEPFGMIYVSAIAQEMRSAGVSFRLENADRHSYAAHMGFYAAFGDEAHESSSHVRGSDRYIAMSKITRAELICEANAGMLSHLGDAIEKRAHRFAGLLTQQLDGDLVDALTYCLREIIRNTFEHSGADEICVCGQFSPASGRVDLAFGDRGSGIKASLTRNPRVDASTDLEAIRVSLLPGISGKDTSTSKRQQRSDDPWRNTGYGLFMAQRICREGGIFTMSSGDALLRLTGDRVLSRENGPRTGTIVGMTLRLSTLEALQAKLLREFSAEGSAISRSLRGANVSASAASLTLRMAPDLE